MAQISDRGDYGCLRRWDNVIFPQNSSKMGDFQLHVLCSWKENFPTEMDFSDRLKFRG